MAADARGSCIRRVLGSFPDWSEPVVFSAPMFRLVVAAAIAAAIAACATPVRDGSRATGGDIVDDFGDTLRLPQPAARIVSLIPVTTEALFALGAGRRLVGRTHWDSSPAEALAVPDLGNGMQPNVEAVLATRPDLIVLYASDGNRAAVAAFRRAGVPTLAMHTDRVADLPRALYRLGRVIGDTVIARLVSDSVTRSLDAVRAMAPAGSRRTVFWHVWDAPVITIGHGSYLDELVDIAGARNVFGDLSQPSPQVTLESVAQRNPDFILAGPVTASRLSAEARWQAVPAVRLHHVISVDTSIVGRPGVRMGEAARYLRALLDSATAVHRP